MTPQVFQRFAIAIVLGLGSAAVVCAQPAIPQQQTWLSHMLQLGSVYCNQADIAAAIGASGVVTEGNVWYYDGTRVYEQVAAYTGDPSWHTCADYVNQQYKAWVLAVTNGVNWPVGALNGWRIFPDGLFMEYQRTGDLDSKEAVRRLATYSAYAASGGDAYCEVSRETAYMIDAYLTAEDIGQPRNPLLATSVNYALGHIDQWFVSKTCPEVQPFMVGLTMEALIRYYARTGDPRIPPQIRLAADQLWSTAWIPAGNGFYLNTGSPLVGVPDLNLLIAPAYAWLWQQTGLTKYLQEGDAQFSGGVLYGNFYSGKQYSQNYRWSFDYVKWRSTLPNSLAFTSTGFLFSRATNTYNGTITVTNTGTVPVTGSIPVELTNLTRGVTLVNATGSTAGTPFIAMPGAGNLLPGHSLTVNVQFSSPSHSKITFTPIVY